jgi:integrase
VQSDAEAKYDAGLEIMLIRPLELLYIPKALDGSGGTNRASRHLAQSDATNDLEAMLAWLGNHSKTGSTFASYRKEGERLLLWSLTELGKPLSSLSAEDLRLYSDFLKNPQPVQRWVSSDGGKYPRDDARWRPFNGPLSQSSQRQTDVVLNAMFNSLVSIGYLRANPISRSLRNVKDTVPPVARYLPAPLWNELKSFVEQLPLDERSQSAYYHRCRWLTTMFYLLGLRISEVSEGRMGQFFCRVGSDRKQKWWFETSGEGTRGRTVPVPPELMKELRRYRKANGLSPLPLRSDNTPLVIPYRGAARCLSRSAVHDAIKSVFTTAAAWLRSKGPDYLDRAAQLEQASAYWLRHTAGLHMSESGVSLGAVQENLGHASAASTYNLYFQSQSSYLHMTDHDFHNDTIKHRLSWPKPNKDMEKKDD